MRKFLPLFLAVSTMLLSNLEKSYAQPVPHLPINPIDVGSISINAGAGLGVPYKGSLGVPFGVKASVNWGVVNVHRTVIALGLASGGSFSHGTFDGASETTSRIYFLARGAIHYGWLARGLDIYGGLSSGVGFDRFHYGDPIDNTTRSAHLLAGVFGGASFFITPGFGFNAEAGDDITILQLGLVAKIR